MANHSRIRSRLYFASIILAASTLVSNRLSAQPQFIKPSIRITARINEAQLVTLNKNTHPLARPEFDHGAAPSDLPMERMLLVLKPSPEQQTALQTLLDQQHDKTSHNYHKWVAPQEFAQQFGAADQDIQTITDWLQSQGFRVSSVSKGKTVIEFSGTARHVRDAFHTEIHKFVVNGAEHWANATDPQIPSALAPVVSGVASLHNFVKRPQLVKSKRSFVAKSASGFRPQFTASSGNHALAPADFATIYNANALYNAGINGTSTTIAVVARTTINVSDIDSFRSVFGLPANSPQIVINGTSPGNLGGDEEAEAVLDATWSGAVAPGANIQLVVSATTNTTDGTDLSELYIVDNNLGDVMTESFGTCEANFTASQADFYAGLAAQAAAQGITYTVAAGDSGAEGCDDPSSPRAVGPLSVNMLASTPYTIAVGGTQFNENGNDSQYWRSTNGSALQSALSYIPEAVWNQSCAGAQCQGATPGLWAGSGGASVLFSKPSWQTGVTGIPADGARDVPDVVLAAANTTPYLICLDGSCTPDTSGAISFQGVGGTSAATPSFAGIMALVVQQTGARQGQANYVLYSLAANQTLSTCNASNTAGLPASTCIFNDVTAGNNAVPGELGYGTSSALYQASSGYDQASGLGSLNVTNLVTNWFLGSYQSQQNERSAITRLFRKPF